MANAEAREKLIQECLVGADGIGAKAARSHSDLDAEELKSVAREALVIEAAKLECDGDAHAILLWRVKMRVRDWLRAHGPGRQVRRGDIAEFVERLPRFSLDQPITKGEDETMADVLAHAPVQAVDPADRIALSAALEQLTARERSILFDRYVLGFAKQEASARAKMSRNTLDKIEMRALRRLRGAMQTDDQPVALTVQAGATGPLGKCEHDVLACAADGLGVIETATQLTVATETVKTQRRKLCAKLEARNIQHAIALAFRTGLLS